jgi:hypothetical protein
MDVSVSFEKVDVIDENGRQKALLAWATARIDQLTGLGADHQLDDYLDWLAYFTREFFGFQQRMLNQCSEQRDYLFRRMEAHCEFRRRLARLSIDMIRNDPTVAERLRSLCHDLLDDAEANEQKLSEILEHGAMSLKLRRQPRRARPAERATQVFEPVGDDEASRAH